MLLSNLNEQVLMPEVGIKTVVPELTNCVDQMVAGGIETGNLGIARRLDAAKLKLIHTLARFSLATWWIQNKYQQMPAIESAAQEIEMPLAIEFIDDFKNSKQHEIIASLSLSKNCAVYENNNEKQYVIDKFQTFPFSFEDLVELTDIVVYTFQRRGLCYQVTDHRSKKNADWLVKRLKNLRRLDQSTLPAILKASPVEEEQSDDVIYQSVIDSLFAERLWLTTRQQLVENNGKLVSFIANQYRAGFLDFDDLVQEGQTGLLAAVDKFNPNFGYQFSTYAAYWIRQRISRALSRNERVIRVPCEQIGSINKLFRAKDELLAKTGKEASVEALADYLDQSVDEINTLLFIAQTTLPLENTDSDEEVLAPIDMIEQQAFEPAFQQIVQSELKNWLEMAIETLNSRESKVICSHFGINTNTEMTLQEIGAELNISRERVRQIQVMAFNKIKLNYGKQLVSFL
jgi:RNA polymerase primary sigma factor